MSGQYQFANPDDGWAYTAIELEAIAHITVTGLDVINGPLAKRWEFFTAAIAWEGNPDKRGDQLTRDVLTRALLAENEDPAVLTLSDWTDGK